MRIIVASASGGGPDIAARQVANELIPADTVIDATTLPKVKMPALEHFVPDTRRR